MGAAGLPSLSVFCVGQAELHLSALAELAINLFLQLGRGSQELSSCTCSTSQQGMQAYLWLFENAP